MRCWKVAQRFWTRLKDVQFQYLGSLEWGGGWRNAPPLSWWTKGILHTLLRHPVLVLKHPFLRPSPHVHIHPAAIDQVYRSWGDYITIFILSIVLCCHLPQILAAIFLCLGFLCIRHVLFLQFGDWSCGGLMVCQSWQGGYPAVPLRQARWCRKLLLEQAANK